MSPAAETPAALVESPIPCRAPSEHPQDPSTGECRNDQSEQNEERRHGAENSRNDDFPRAARD